MRRQEEIQQAFADTEELVSQVYFCLIGIGGAGMSAIARMLHFRGYTVCGADLVESGEVLALRELGIEVQTGHSPELIKAGMAVVLSDAIDLDTSPEFARAKELGLNCFRRTQVLGWLLKDRKVIAVTGTHGKTTTTGMIGAGLQSAGASPLIVVGASVPQFGGQVVEGPGEWAVVEACEAYNGFHDLQPQIVVLTNLELDHADFHGNYERLRESVVQFVDTLPADGWLVYCSEDRGASEVAELSNVRAMPYGISASWVRQSFNIMGQPAPDLGDLPSFDESDLHMPGIHNKLNAAGAIMAVMLSGHDVERGAEGILRFEGAERRLQVIHDGEVTVVDDYAHHPTEVQASLSALRTKFAGRKIRVVFQPHLYSRTAPLVADFAQALSLADEVVLTDIYPAREDPMPGMSSALIAEKVAKPCRYVPNRHLLPRLVAGWTSKGDVVVGMGAGNISEFAPALIEELNRKSAKSYRVAVVFGGDSAEREVSIHTGRYVADALERLGHTPVMVDVSNLLLSDGDLSVFTGPGRPEVAFLAVHGTHAEDGAIQGLFELLSIPYVGSGIQASALAMDKALTKTILRDRGLPVVESTLVTRKTPRPVPIEPWRPVVVKPNAQGSTVGLSFVKTPEQLEHALDLALAYDDAALVEDWVTGMEISVPVLGGRALTPVEICPVSGMYDFANKYTPGATEEIAPARLPQAVLNQVCDIAVRAHQALGCEGATRTDMIVQEPQGDARPIVLEVNTLPGMTGTSLFPRGAAASGMTFDEVVGWLVEDARRRYAEKTS